MNPWTLIGWWIVGTVSVILFVILLLCVVMILLHLRWFIRYFRTRNVLPKVGQRWLTISGECYRVTHLHSEGGCWVQCGNSGSGFTAAEFRSLVRAHHLVLGDES